eukprot:712821-Rhodomonas_salina.3
MPSSSSNPSHTFSAVLSSSALPPLPKGWERRLDPKGRPYYINWEDRSSQWDPPPGYSEPAAIRHVERFDEEGRGSIDDGGEGGGGGRALVENDGGTQEEWGEEAEQADEEGGGRTLQITQNGFNLTEEDKRLLEEEVERLSMESPLWRLAAEANFNLSTLCRFGEKACVLVPASLCGVRALWGLMRVLMCVLLGSMWCVFH